MRVKDWEGSCVGTGGAGVLHGVGTTRTDEFNKKSAQKGEINTPKP